MIGSMFVGFIIGLIAAAITNRGEKMGCILIRLVWGMDWSSPIWKLGTSFIRNSHYSICIRSHYSPCYFLEERELIQKKQGENHSHPTFSIRSLTFLL